MDESTIPSAAPLPFFTRDVFVLTVRWIEVAMNGP
jgi:hypothetical protein